MGMLEYSLTFIHENCRIVHEKGMWKLSGTSDLPVRQIEDLLAETCTCCRVAEIEGASNEWVFDECIHILIFQEDGWFQGLELTGSLAYFDKGIEQCYACYERWSETIPLWISVLDQSVQAANCSEFYDVVAEVYGKKVEWFRRAYGDIEWKVSSGGFHRELRRRQGLWYRLGRYFHREK